MKIIESTKSVKSHTYKDVDSGGAFRHNKRLYIKLTDLETAVDLVTGDQEYFDDNAKIIKVNAEVHILS